jgi:HK97 family phage major capsid protein/HK97 family phage prohead protease
MGDAESSQPPTDNLFRAQWAQPFELRDTEGSEMPTMVGHFAVFNRWTEINSFIEGRFMERMAPGAFRKTLRENRDRIKVLFQHGKDPQIGEKVLGPLQETGEDERGGTYEVPLLDTSYNRDLLPGLKAGLYGSSFRFRVMKEDVDQRPKPSDHNPEGIPERTVIEAHVMEFGPVTFPAYAEAGVGIRSITDDITVATVMDKPDLVREVIRLDDLAEQSADEVSDQSEDNREADALEADGAGADHSDETSRVTSSTTSDELASAIRDELANINTEQENDMQTVREMIDRESEITARLQAMTAEYAGRLPADEQEEWDRLKEELLELRADIKADRERRAFIREMGDNQSAVEDAAKEWRPSVIPKQSKLPRNVHAVQEYRLMASSYDELPGMYREGAKRVLEDTTFADPDVDQADAKQHVDRLLSTVDSERGELAKRMLVTGSPTYHRAFGKFIAGRPRTNEEEMALQLGDERALSETTTAGGFAVPFQLDPTVIATSNGVVNPLRAISRVETITTNEWRGVSSAGITASYAAEATEASDNAPVLAQPVCFPERAQAFVPFSREIGGDWGSLQTEMSTMFRDAKDQLEATKFLTGLGHASTEPQGLLVGGTAIVTTAGTAAIAVADLYSLEEALPPRFRPLARFVGSKFIYNKVRQFDTGGGASLWVRLGDGLPPELIGYPSHELSTMTAALTSAGSVLIIGDFRHFLILDRVGMSVDLIPHLFGTANNRPTGQSGLYAFWRNSSQVLAWQAFRTLKTL